MKLPLKYGVPAMVLLIVGLNLVQGPLRTVMMVATAGVAAWMAFSLPRPPAQSGPEQPGHASEYGPGLGDGDSDGEGGNN